MPRTRPLIPLCYSNRYFINMFLKVPSSTNEFLLPLDRNIFNVSDRTWLYNDDLPDTKVVGCVRYHFSTRSTIWGGSHFHGSPPGGGNSKAAACWVPGQSWVYLRGKQAVKLLPKPGKGEGKLQTDIFLVKTLSQTFNLKGFWRVSSMFLQDVKEVERLTIKTEVWQAVFPELNALLVVFWKKKRILLWKCHTPKKFLEVISRGVDSYLVEWMIWLFL